MLNHPEIIAFMSLPANTEWLVILLIALLVFGKKLPEVARGMGRSVVEFKKGLKGIQDGMSEADREADRQANEEIAKQKDPAQLT